MIGHLERICSNRGIDVSFITDKFIDFQYIAEHEFLKIRVHEIFKNCPLRIAKALIAICIEQDVEKEYTAIVEDYLRETLKTDNINITSSNVDVNNIEKKGELKGSKTHNSQIKTPAVREQKMPSPGLQKQSATDNNLEANISTIEITSLWSGKLQIEKDQSLIVPDDDIMELNIVVEPPLHK